MKNATLLEILYIDLKKECVSIDPNMRILFMHL